MKVMGGDRQTVSLAGLHLLGELADRVGLPARYSAAVPTTGERSPVHDRGRLLTQVAVMLAGGGRCVADLAALRDQPGLFGEVASAATVWRTFDRIDPLVLDGLRADNLPSTPGRPPSTSPLTLGDAGPRSLSSTCPCPAGRRGHGRSCAANAPTRALSCGSGTTTAGATRSC